MWVCVNQRVVHRVEVPQWHLHHPRRWRSKPESGSECRAHVMGGGCLLVVSWHISTNPMRFDEWQTDKLSWWWCKNIDRNAKSMKWLDSLVTMTLLLSSQCGRKVLQPFDVCSLLSFISFIQIYSLPRSHKYQSPALSSPWSLTRTPTAFMQIKMQWATDWHADNQTGPLPKTVRTGCTARWVRHADRKQDRQPIGQQLESWANLQESI